MSTQNETKLESTIAEELPIQEETKVHEQKSPNKPNESQKLIEAKTAVVLLKDSRLCTKNEYTQWLLKMLYQPCLRKDSEAMNVLYLSRNRRKIWATDFSINQDPSIKKNTDQLYVITPKTTIMTISQENRLVYIIDLSSSLSTVGNTRADILLSKVFQTLKVSLEGLVQPFSMQVTPTQKVIIEPTLRLTVMADCSQFASNVNVIQMLVDHPTMSVFIQNKIITSNNIHTIIKKLQTEFLNFQETTVQFRKFMKKKREHMGYNLDVGNEVAPPGTFDATSLLKQTSFSADSSPLDKTPMYRSSSDFDLSSKSRDTSFYSSKKEVWGIGKSGANLSRILHAGHFALKLLAHQGRAQLVLITDGAMKSNVHDNTFVRQFAEEDITCHIIQIGYSSGFIPGRNFGFVPDTEILQFLARATNGSFMYSDACTPQLPDDTVLFYGIESPTMESSPAKEYPVVQFVDINKAKHIQTPNIFHRQFLFREIILTRHHHSELRLQTDGDAQGRRDLGGNSMMENDILRERYNFPWDPYAKAPEGDWRLLKYREYTLPSEFSHIIAARAREGFMVQSVVFDDGTGSKHLDSGIKDLEASNLQSVRKERIQIIMTMRWQPNIVIEYRIKATWLPTIIGNGANTLSSQDILMSSNIFSRGKAPRAEIFVRTDAGFAHMLQNWDMLKRRAQMMGVVTGSIYFGEAYAAPVYSKIEKLKTYLVDIYEGDEVLRTIIGFPSKFWMSSNVESSSYPSHASSSVVQQMNSYIESFKTVWERINNSEARARTRCWYDPGCIDLLVGDVSPFMTPKLSSTYNEEFVLNIEEDILIMLNYVKDVVREWSDFEAEDGTFVRIVHKLASVNSEDMGAPYPPSFCELRVRHEYGRLITLRLLFFNVEVLARQKIIEHLVHLVKTNKYTKASCNLICKRPFSRMLMRDNLHFTDITTTGSNNEISVRPAGNLTRNQSRAKAWYLPVAMWLTSEYIVRDYLKHMNWSWQTDSHQDSYHKENKMMPIHDLAFQFLCQVRLDQGYHLVSPRQDSAQFYQEINILDHEGKNPVLCAIQYFVWKDSDTGKITTEIWIEPSNDQYELIKKWTFEPDRKTISQLVTFDQIHTIGRQKGVGDFKKKGGSDIPDGDSSIMLLPQLFDVASVLRSNKFIVSSFRTPEYNMVLLPHSKQQIKLKSLSNHMDEQDASDHSGNSTPIIRNRPVYGAKPHRHVRRHAHPSIPDEHISTPVTLDNNQKLFSFRPDPLLNKNKETIAKLDVILQNFALLHYFVERSLSYISSGEILMSHHDVGAAFWQELRNALQSASKNGCLSSTSLIPDLRKTRCFVKIFDPRSFVVILCPSLESVSNGLLKLQEEDRSKSISTVEQCRLLDIFMFECVRQKPMRPTKSEDLFSGADKETNTIQIESIIEQPDTITIKPIEYLIHESDGLGVMLRPTLFKGRYSSCQDHAQLTDRVLRVAQDVSRYYSRSFFKSFYACLMRGFMMDDDDLNKVLEVCNESLMEIDITEFVNTMTMQKQECIESNEVQELEIQAKFNAIFHQYFEIVQTKNKSISNLFYYKPPFARDDNSDPRQEHLPHDDKISFIVDLVAYAETPLLLRLNVAYKTASSSPDSEFVAPVTSLPTSYSGQLANGEKFDLEEENSVNSEMFPIGPLDKKVYLQIVCLNMPRSYMDDYNLPDNLSPYTDNPIIQSMQSQPEWFSSLSQDQKAALAETDCRLSWLLKEETIHGLLKTPIITLPILQYVEAQLSAPCPFVDYETSIKLPFQFVKNYAESRHIFMNELEKDSCCHNKGKYLMKRVGDYFYVCEDSIINMGEEASYSNNASPIVTEPSRSIIDNERDMISHPTDDDFCDGLGISLSKISEKQDMMELESFENDASTPLDKRPLYWLLLIPYERYIQIYFYSKLPIPGAKSDILNPIKEKIRVIEERTNRLALLNYLQETRMCSKYLEIPSDPHAIYSEEEDSEEDTPGEEIQDIFNPSGNTKFSPGQFSCPLVFTRRFPLHWRLQPNVALKFLTSDVLRLFTVINRPNMFVIERDGSIIYCKIYEENLDVEYEGSPNTMYGSPVHTLNDKNVDDDALTLVENTPRREMSKSSASPRPRMSSGSRMTANEKRELVLEVYGVDLPDWVEVEFVNMIENRLVSQITLNEIQQFFARNSTSKPTAADVDFILPIHKPITQREMLRVPNLVNSPYKLLQFFKSSLIADNIRPLSGPYVRQAISHYYDNIFFEQERDAIQDGSRREVASECEKSFDIPAGSFCFYYNCLKRLPGMSTPLELSAGQGIAGICLTLLDEAGVPLSKVHEDGMCGKNFDPEVIHQCLEEEFREAKEGTTFFHIWVDIWVTGAVDSNALTQHIYECYRQSLCDYFIEKTVTIDLGAALSIDGALQRAVTSKKSEGRLGTVVRKKFIESVLFILKKASELKSPTVCSMDKSIQSNPWCMDDLIRYIDIELVKIDPSLRPTVAWTSLGNDIWNDDDDMYNTDSKWDLYRGFQYRQRQKLQSNIRLVAISGLDEFVEKLGSVSDALLSERRLSATSDNDSQRGRSRRSSGESANTDGGSSQRKMDQSRGSESFLSRHGPKLDSQKHCFLLMTLDVHRLSVYAYNWSESVSQELFNGLNRVINRQEARNDIMVNILHQKMGLFHHSQSIKSVIERFSDTNETKATTGNLSTGTTFSMSNHHSSPSKGKLKAKKPDTTPSIRTPGRASTSNTPVTTSQPVASMLDLKDMIAFPTTAPSREKTNEECQADQIDRILQKSTIRTTELDQALMDSSTDSVADTIRSRDFDILRRHGQPFLEAFLRRTKIHSAHRKALKVYLKWRKRYGQPQENMDNAERLTRPEVAIIMRSSRVLHFCRTPLIFCDPEKDWSYLPEDSSARAIVVDWFKEMATALTSEYAKYLEGADMQLIDFAKCGNDETLLKASKFSLGKKVNADCLPTFLLRVFEGGSIICEVRLTKVFVSVTLYTLHRQYGRLDYNRFRPETRMKKRRNFKKFEENSGHFKQMIHINSFVYDFQLHYLQKMLQQTVPADIDILAFIQRFAMTNQQPSPYSKDRIIHGFYQVAVDSLLTASFFDNLFKNAHRYGLQHVLSRTGYSGVTVTSSDLSFYVQNAEDSRWKYTLVMSPVAEQEKDQIMIEYFVLVVCQEQTTPETMTKTSWVKSDTVSRHMVDLKDLSLPEEGYTIADIVSGARVRLDQIVSEVIISCKRVHNWSTIYSADIKKFDHEKLIQLMSEFDRIDIRKADENLAQVFSMQLDWNAAIDLIKSIKKTSTRDFYQDGYRHLLIYNTRYMDFMIHLRVDSQKQVEGWMVSREKRSVFEGAEREQLVSLGKILYYHMWRVIAK